MEKKATCRWHLVAFVVLGLACARPSPSGPEAGVFGGAAQSIIAAGRVWGPALMMLGGLVAGGAIATGSAHAGDRVRKFIVGAVFLLLAAGGVALILSVVN